MFPINFTINNQSFSYAVITDRVSLAYSV